MMLPLSFRRAFVICIASIAAIAFAARLSVHNLRASSGQEPRVVLARAFDITIPDVSTFSANERMLRVITRPFNTGESVFLARWPINGGVEITTKASNACINCIVSGLEPDQHNVKIATITQRSYCTKDPRVVELLNLLWDQLTRLPLYEQMRFLDPAHFDFELYDKTGVKRRMTLQDAEKPYQGSLYIEVAERLEQFPLAHRKEAWDREVIDDYTQYVKKNPDKILSPTIQEVLASHPSEKALLAQCSEMTAKLRSTEQIIAGFVYDPKQDFSSDPKTGHPLQIEITTPHLPSEKYDYFFSKEGDGDKDK